MSQPWLSAEEIAPTSESPRTRCMRGSPIAACPHQVGRLWKFQTVEVDEWLRRRGAAPESGVVE